MTTRSRVLVVDALPLAGLGLRTLLDSTRDLVSCGSTANLTVAMRAIRDVRPDVVLIDSALDTTATAARAILATQPALAMVALVRDDAGLYLRAAREAGIRGLVQRSATPTTIITAIRTVRMGGQLLDPNLSLQLTGRVDPKLLSDRQSAVLELIATGRGNAEIAETLGVSTETVRSHVKAILLRLQAHDRAHAVARGYQTGLLTTRRPPFAAESAGEQASLLG